MSDDEKLMREAFEALRAIGCQFWACQGPTLEPIPMVTCAACETVAKLAQRLEIKL